MIERNEFGGVDPLQLVDLQTAHLERAEVVKIASPELVDETISRATYQFPEVGRTYKIDDRVDAKAWTDIAREWGSTPPDDFLFNRVRRLYTPERVGLRKIASHRDHPDFQGEVDIMQVEGEVSGSVQGLGFITLKAGTLLRLVGWPLGKPYPHGKFAQRSIEPGDPRTEHQFHHKGPRQAVALTYDANPDNHKGKFT